MSEPVWLGLKTVQRIHAEQLARFGGPPGVRDHGALESALWRPVNRWAYGACDFAELASSYAFGIARNHPFIDGNKRTGTVAAIVFLALNGIELQADETQLEQLVIDVAKGQAGKSSVADFFRKNSLT